MRRYISTATNRFHDDNQCDDIFPQRRTVFRTRSFSPHIIDPWPFRTHPSCFSSRIYLLRPHGIRTIEPCDCGGVYNRAVRRLHVVDIARMPRPVHYHGPSDNRSRRLATLRKRRQRNKEATHAPSPAHVYVAKYPCIRL